jgi:hypothetical protein
MIKRDVELDSFSLSQRTGIKGGHGHHDNTLRVDGTKGLVIMHPESLVTPTRIAESCSCLRRAVLSERVRGLDGGLSGIPAVMGNLKHLFIEVSFASLFGLHQIHTVYCFSQKIFDMYLKKSDDDNAQEEAGGFSSRVSKHNVSDIFKLIFECISVHAEALSSVQVSDGTAFEEVHSLLVPLMEWISKCIPQQYHQLPPQLPPTFLKRHSTAPTPRPGGGGGGGMPMPSRDDLEIDIFEVLGVEETLNCAALGMKGQVDMIVDASLAQEESAVIPIELKTGKWSPQGLISHRAQVCVTPLCL